MSTTEAKTPSLGLRRIMYSYTTSCPACRAHCVCSRTTCCHCFNLPLCHFNTLDFEYIKEFVSLLSVNHNYFFFSSGFVKKKKKKKIGQIIVSLPYNFLEKCINFSYITKLLPLSSHGHSSSQANKNTKQCFPILLFEQYKSTST